MRLRKPAPVAERRQALAKKEADSERAIIANQVNQNLRRTMPLILVFYGANPKAITELGVAT